MRAPIWLASRMRCASPPGERGGGPVQAQVADAHGVEEAQPRRGSPAAGAPPPAARARSKRQGGEGRRRASRHGQARRTRRWCGRPGARPGSPAQARALALGAGRLRRGRAAGRRRPRAVRAARGRLLRRRRVEPQAGLTPCGADRRARPGTSRRPGAGPAAPGGAARETGDFEREAVARATSSSASRTRRGPWRCQGWMAPSSQRLVLVRDHLAPRRRPSATPRPSHGGQAP